MRMYIKTHETPKYKIVAFLSHPSKHKISFDICFEIILPPNIAIRGFKIVETKCFPQTKLQNYDNTLIKLIVEPKQSFNLKLTLSRLFPTIFNEKYIRTDNWRTYLKLNATTILDSAISILGADEIRKMKLKERLGYANEDIKDGYTEDYETASSGIIDF